MDDGDDDGIDDGDGDGDENFAPDGSKESTGTLGVFALCILENR